MIKTTRLWAAAALIVVVIVLATVYLRSALPEHARWDDQAHAYAYLPDQLAIEKVAVVAMSQGGSSALLFAVLHPQRVSSLTLISCGVASAATQSQAQADEKGAMLTTIFQYDPAYWAVSRLFKRQLMALIGAGAAVRTGLTLAQRALFERFIDAGFAAATIPHARLMRFDRGGISSSAWNRRRSAQLCAIISLVHSSLNRPGILLDHQSCRAATTQPGLRL